MSDTKLSQLVQEECLHLGIEYSAQAKSEPLTQQEKQSIEKSSFPSELKFTVPVDLCGSKKAFLSVVSGLGDGVCFGDLWSLKPHDIRADHNPMGTASLDLSFFWGK